MSDFGSTQLSLRRLEIFCLVVEERSVTRAAEVMLVAQPAVSAQLRSLESWIGARLFQRQGNRLLLTEAGERVHRWARGVLASSAAIRREISDVDSGLSGRLVVFSSLALGTYVVPRVVTRLSRERPAADITVAVSQPNEAVEGVETGLCDMAVINWDQRELPSTIRAERVASATLGVYVAPRLVPRGARLSAEEALRLPFVGAPSEVVYQRNLEQQLRSADLPLPRFVLRLGHAEAMKVAAMENGWAMIAPAFAVRPEVADGRLVAVEVAGLHLSEDIVLLSRRDKLWSPLQEVAAQSMRREIPALVGASVDDEGELA